jgi:hypothetical protein
MVGDEGLRSTIDRFQRLQCLAVSQVPHNPHYPWLEGNECRVCFNNMQQFHPETFKPTKVPRLWIRAAVRFRLIVILRSKRYHTTNVL